MTVAATVDGCGIGWPSSPIKVELDGPAHLVHGFGLGVAQGDDSGQVG
jgi:hypothetical protein